VEGHDKFFLALRAGQVLPPYPLPELCTWTHALGDFRPQIPWLGPLLEYSWIHLCVFPPHLHLTTSKVMVIVWRLRGNIIITVLYIANVLPLKQEQLTKTVHTARLGLEFVFLFFRLHDLSLCWCMFCFTLNS